MLDFFGFLVAIFGGLVACSLLLGCIKSILMAGGMSDGGSDGGTILVVVLLVGASCMGKVSYDTCGNVLTCAHKEVSYDKN